MLDSAAAFQAASGRAGAEGPATPQSLGLAWQSPRGHGEASGRWPHGSSVQPPILCSDEITRRSAKTRLAVVHAFAGAGTFQVTTTHGRAVFPHRPEPSCVGLLSKEDADLNAAWKMLCGMTLWHWLNVSFPINHSSVDGSNREQSLPESPLQQCR